MEHQSTNNKTSNAGKISAPTNKTKRGDCNHKRDWHRCFKTSTSEEGRRAVDGTYVYRNRADRRALSAHTQQRTIVNPAQHFNFACVLWGPCDVTARGCVVCQPSTIIGQVNATMRWHAHRELCWLHTRWLAAHTVIEHDATMAHKATRHPQEWYSASDLLEPCALLFRAGRIKLAAFCSLRPLIPRAPVLAVAPTLGLLAGALPRAVFFCLATPRHCLGNVRGAGPSGVHAFLFALARCEGGITCKSKCQSGMMFGKHMR